MKPMSMLTTTDNPYDPFTQFDDWLGFDEAEGYRTNEYIARIAKTSDELSDTDNELAISDAIDEIVYLNVTGNYKVVFKDDGRPTETKELNI